MANKYLRKTLRPDAAVETTILTVPEANVGVLRSLRVTNTIGTATNVSVTQYVNGTGPATFLLKARSLPGSQTFDVFNGVPCVLEEGDVIKVLSSGASCHFYLSYLEIDRN
jgi:hypothetical protein